MDKPSTNNSVISDLDMIPTKEAKKSGQKLPLKTYNPDRVKSSIPKFAAVPTKPKTKLLQKPQPSTAAPA